MLFRSLRRMLGWFARTQFPKDLLAKIDFPTLLIQGGADLLTSPPEAAEQWSRALASVPKGAELATIPGAVRTSRLTFVLPADVKSISHTFLCTPMLLPPSKRLPDARLRSPQADLELRSRLILDFLERSKP